MSGKKEQRTRQMRDLNGNDITMNKAGRRREKPKQKKSAWIIGIILTVISICAGAFLGWLLVTSKLLPGKYTILAIIVIVGLLVLARFILGFKPKKIGKGRYITGVVLTLAISVLFAALSYYIYQPVEALKDITGNKTQTTVYGIYVPADSDAKDINDVANATFAVMNTPTEASRIKKVTQMIQGDTGKPVSTVGYNDMFSTAQALLDGDTNAMIMNQSFMDVISGVDEEDDSSTSTSDSSTSSNSGSPDATSGSKTSNNAMSNFANQVKCIATYDVTEKVSTSQKNEQDNPDGTFTVLISGSDTRGSLNSTGRNDVNILATINPKTHTILLVNTPRDYYVPLSISGGVRDKLTHAGIYGEQVSQDTLAQLYDTNVDYNFRINFVGFKKVIDALGGVTVHSDYAFTSDAGYSFVQGDNQMDGEKALAFVRERHHLSGGDNQRGKDQMYVIQAVVNKMMSPAILKNYATLWSSLSDCFNTSVPYDTVSSLVQNQLDSGAKWNIQQYAVTGTGASKTSFSMPNQRAYVMIPDESTVEQAKKLIDEVYAGESVKVE